MKPSILAILSLCLLVPCGSYGQLTQEDADGTDFTDLDADEHLYWHRPLNDPFTQFHERLTTGQVSLDTSSELNYLRSLLTALKIPVDSQMLVFSTTSLQLRLISPRNPRAVYFNENIHIGYIPGGRIEVISIDPDLGAIFYIYDIPAKNAAPVLERSERCMNCHAKPSIGGVPGITVKSVMPGPNGGSLDEYRKGVFGHQIPFEERFGGWHVTGAENLISHRGNQNGKLFQGELTTTTFMPGERCDITRYPVPTSDILPHLLHEHQAGFTNRCNEATYRARSYWEEGNGKLSPEHLKILKAKAAGLVRYLLFAEEASFPKGGFSGNDSYQEAFRENRKADAAGRSLKDFDLETRLFKYRCSYMIYSNAFTGLPDYFKKEVIRQVRAALDPRVSPADFNYLPNAEKTAIAEILRDTLEAW